MTDSTRVSLVPLPESGMKPDGWRRIAEMTPIRYSIKTKIFFVILVPALILLSAVYLDYMHLSALGRSAELILSENYRSIKAAHQIGQSLENNQNRILGVIFLQDREKIRDLPSDEEILGLLRICKNNITEPGEGQIIDGLLDKYAMYHRLYQELKGEVSRDGNLGPGGLPYELISLTASMHADLNRLVTINEEAMEAAQENTRRIAEQAMRYSMGLLVSAILFTLLFSLVLSSRISRPLIDLARSIAQIKEGSGHYPRFPITTRDEIGFLTSEFNRLLERLKVYDQLSADKLMAEKRKVRRAEEAKAQFIADLSHQLKTPMTSLSMGVNILAEKTGGLLDAKYERLMETARDDCARLSALINELVDIARLDGMLKPRAKETLRIEDIVDECVKPLAYQAEEKGVSLETSIDPDLPPLVIDSLRFPWVITNLLGNAIRYTDRGGRVALKVQKSGNRCSIQCIDTGVGIEAEFLPHIFDRFTQFSERRRRGAIGLGLAIAKEIIEEHGGDIAVESRTGGGTTFTFWIPIEVEERDEDRPRSG